jgi:peptide-methionine (R)-S-oxide reductase
MTSRRTFLLGSAATGILAACSFGGDTSVKTATDAADGKFEVAHTESEWRKILSPAAFNVMRREDTEPPGSSPLDAEQHNGVYSCAGCDLPLFGSETKFHSGTGWPSFWKPLDNAIATKVDGKLYTERTEVHCRRCGGHLGHVFDDGPPPTGLRYCMNGLSLKFVAA